MDLRDPLPPQHHQHPQTPPGMMSPPQNSYNSPSMPTTTTTMNTNSPMLQNPRFPFNSGPPKPMESINQQYGDGPHLAPPQQPPSGFGIESGKKKRGRPRKYSPDSNIALGLAPSPSTVTPVTGASPLAVVGGYGDSGGGPMSSDPSQAKRSRGRPPGSGKKQLDALGSFGVSFTPHVILVKAGEDIASKIMDFSRQGPRTVCILSANGAISNITLRQPAMSGGNVTYEGDELNENSDSMQAGVELV